MFSVVNRFCIDPMTSYCLSCNRLSHTSVIAAFNECLWLLHQFLCRLASAGRGWPVAYQPGRAIKNNSWTSLTDSRGTAKCKSYLHAGQRQKFALNSSDQVFHELRDLSFAAVGPELGKRTKGLRTDYQGTKGPDRRSVMTLFPAGMLTSSVDLLPVHRCMCLRERRHPLIFQSHDFLYC